MDNRGQSSSLDLVIASLLLVLIQIAIAQAWKMAVLRINSYADKKTLDNKLVDVSELLVATGGDPVDWYEKPQINPLTVNTIGFAGEDNVLDYARLDRAKTIGYDDFKEMLGLSKEEFRLTVRDVETPGAGIAYEFGGEPSGTRASITRYALLNGSVAEVTLSLYYANTTYMNT